MAGLVPAIHVARFRIEVVDARHKAGYDELEIRKQTLNYSPRTAGAALALPGKVPALRENTALARTRRSPLTIRNALAKASRLPTLCTSTCASTQSPTFGAPAKSAHTLAVVSAAGGSWLNAAR